MMSFLINRRSSSASSKPDRLPRQLTLHICHGSDTDPFCLLVCDVELPLWDFSDMKLYRESLVLNKCHFHCLTSDCGASHISLITILSQCGCVV